MDSMHEIRHEQEFNIPPTQNVQQEQNAQQEQNFRELNAQRLKEMQRGQVDEQRINNRDKYIHKGNLIDVSRSEHQNEYKLGDVRYTVLHNMPQAYNHLVDMQAGEVSRKVELHHSRGTKLYNQDENVLEFDIGGSGYKEFQHKHINLGGKDNIFDTIEGKKVQFSVEEVAENYERFQRTKKYMEVSWYNKCLSWIKGIKSPKEIRQLNALTAKHGKDARRLYYEKYGHRAEEPELSKLKNIHVKEKEKTIEGEGIKIKKKRVTMGGPRGTFLGFKPGMRNSGDYSIKNLRKYMLIMGKSYCEPIFKEWEIFMDNARKYEAAGDSDAAIRELGKLHNINIIIKGHSRGAVASAQGAMMIKYWVHNTYPQFEEYVKFETTQYDPVPGTGSEEILGERENLEINLKGDKNAEKRLEKKKMMELGNSAETTVVYSLHTQHTLFFSPQMVNGAKRIILTPFSHDAGLNVVDKTQKYRSETEKHRVGFTDSRTGEVYRGSGINQLDEGVYILDENNVLVKIPDAATGEKIIDKLVKNTSLQKERHERLKTVVRTWFESHSND